MLGRRPVGFGRSLGWDGVGVRCCGMSSFLGNGGLNEGQNCDTLIKRVVSGDGCAPVAQWTEHRSSEPRVGGSNPFRRAKHSVF